jgi:hypothetical protein
MPKHAILVPLLLAPLALAEPTIRPLLVTGDLLPDGTTVTGTSDQPVIDGDLVAALVATSAGKAIVRINVVTGSIQIIANHQTPSPTHPGFLMSDFRQPAIHDGIVVFSAGSNQATGIDTYGIYRSDGGPVEVVVDATTEPLLFPQDCFADGSTVLFKRTGAGDPLFQVPLSGGPVEVFAARSMPTPDGGEMIDIERGIIHAGGGAMAARVSAPLPGVNYAVYRFLPPSNTLSTIVRTGDPMPGHPDRALRGPLANDVSGDAVLYAAGDDGWPRSFGILCLDTLSGNTVIADGDTPVPGLPGRVFDSFSGATDGRDVFFLGSAWWGAPEVIGAYWWRDGVIHKVISTQDSIDGLPVTFIRFNARCVDHGRAVMSLELNQFQRVGLFLAEFPSPCPVDLDASGTLNFFDVAAFLTAFNTQNPAADFAEPTDIFNFFDVAAFLAAYSAGCP